MAVMRKTYFAALLLLFITTPSYSQISLTSWMDDQYTAPILANARDCFATVYEFNEVAHVNGRDCAADEGRTRWIEVARPQRVNKDVLSPVRKDITIPGRISASGVKSANVETFEVGDPKTAEFAVIFIHGVGADKRLGARDTNIGGNFNRLMNLVVRSKGVYYTPTTNFEDGGEGVQTIIEKLQKDRPSGTKVILACGSAGAAICHDIAHRKDSAPFLAGLVLVGGAGGLGDFTNSYAYKKRVPVIIAHGSRDGVDSVIDDFIRIRKQPHEKNYPIWIQVYNDGGHMTPVRLIDWKMSLAWIFDENSKQDPHFKCTNQNPGDDAPKINRLLATVKETGRWIGSISCKHFLKYPFIRSRPPGAKYLAKDKSSCYATKKEETPGEDLHIIAP